ncbi:MAG: adenylate cyclase [Saprospiraceae bacterium]|jgi:adenylate cyclase
MLENSFFQELKRRNFSELALIFLAVGCVILQAASIILLVFNAPVLAMCHLLIGLILLFPPWLILAWVYDYTPKEFKKTDEIKEGVSVARFTSKRLNSTIMGGMAVAIVLLATADRIFNSTENILNTSNYV